LNDSLDLPNVTDEQALGGPAIRLADYSDDTLEMSAGRVGKFGPGWTEAAHSADACANCGSLSATRNFWAVRAVQKGLLPHSEIPQSAERAARGNPGGSFDGALKAAQDVRRGRKRERRRANPAFRERTGRPARRPRRRSRRRARRAHVPHHANRVPRPGVCGRFGAHVREERNSIAL
jgi:hypothetical protein